ncbi:MAG: RNA-binding protein [Planctomycetota bacterium]|nr:MAG: RNA-binding protein [Planctomycetota bacterium]
MGTKLYVGNLPFSMDTDSLRDQFSAHGEVVDAIVLTDRDTGRSRGFGFVTFASDDQAASAAEALDGADCDGRRLTVNEARERTERPRGAGGGGGGGRGGFRGGDRGGDRGGFRGNDRGGDRW